MEVTSMEQVMAIRAKIQADEPVTDDELRAALAFIRQDRTAVPTKKAATKKATSKSVPAPATAEELLDLI